MRARILRPDIRPVPHVPPPDDQPNGALVVLDRVRRARSDASDCRSPSSPAARVLVAEGHALVRAGFRALLEREGTISVVAEAGAGEEAVELARRLRPDVVLIDARVPGLDAVEATARIFAESGVAIMLLTASEHDACVLPALRAGASGLLLTDTEPAELVRGVEVVARGQALLAPNVARRLIAELASRPALHVPRPDLLEELTAREREVVALVAHGLSNGEIAERLVISPATAKTHVSRAMVKLACRDRAQLVVLAYETGLVRPRSRP
jgi:DNA-binding NarL/FixJ family response regulator